jgi:LacI family transcriptional regulator
MVHFGIDGVASGGSIVFWCWAVSSLGLRTVSQKASLPISEILPHKLGQESKKVLTSNSFFSNMVTLPATFPEMALPTIVDIAKKLGISASTVSRALNDHPDCSQRTKELVRRTAAALSYSPNPSAKSLKSNRTTTIGVIVPEIEHDFFSSAISGIEEVASKSSHTIIVCQSNENYEREVENTNLMVRHRVAGVIVSISLTTKNGQHFQVLSKRRIPLVFFDRVCDDVTAPKVIIDDYQSAYDAVSYLINKGRRKIAHFGGSREVGIYSKRNEGYVDAMEKNQLPVLEKLMTNGQSYEEHGYNSFDALLRENNIPDAIFAVNDTVAIGAFQRIKEANLKIPEDVAIIGFSNDKITHLTNPPITTVNQPSKEMGKKAAEILIEIIEGKPIEPTTLVMPTTLIVRASA